MKHEPSVSRKTDKAMTSAKRKEVDQVRKAERINISLEMRKQAYNLRDIAEALDCSTSTVRQYLREGLSALNEMNLELAHAYRDLQVGRVEEQLKVWRPLALDVSDIQKAGAALDRVMKLEAQLMKLVGTESLPIQQVDVDVNVGPPVVEFVMPADFQAPPDRTLPPLKHGKKPDEAVYITEAEYSEQQSKTS